MGEKYEDKKDVFVGALAMIIVLQMVREGIELVIHQKVPMTLFMDRMTTMTIMILLTIVVVVFAECQNVSLSIWPKRFGIGYIILAGIAGILFITGIFINKEDYKGLLVLVYGCVVTPIYEELIFRGFIWERFNEVFSKEVFTFLWNVIFFVIWHIGYMLPQFMEGNWEAVIGKMIAGLGYGIVLGVVRLMTKNCYSTIMVHGILNLLMV